MKGKQLFEHSWASFVAQSVKNQHSLALPFFGIGIKTDFTCPVATAEFSKLVDILSVVL